MQKILKIKIAKRPEFYLLGIDKREVPTEDRTLTWYMLTAARITYAKVWKQNKIPKVIEWLEETCLGQSN